MARPVSRRSILGAALAVGAAWIAGPSRADVGLLSSEAIPLWPHGGIPGQGPVVRTEIVQRGAPDRSDRIVVHLAEPSLEVFRPGRPNGAAVLVMPGGGYARLAIDKEGAGAASWLTALGYTVFALNYRLPGDGWTAGFDAPLQDAQRAMRMIRADAATWAIDPERVGVVGFSAGGHLAGTLMTRHDAPVYEPVDERDQTSARPAWSVLAYPMTSVARWAPTGSDAAVGLDRAVRPGIGPVFLVHAADDAVVPVDRSVTLFQALRTADVPAEMHIYPTGGHGFAFAPTGDDDAPDWTSTLRTWLAGRT